MIKTKKGVTEAEGSVSELLADVSIIIFTLKKNLTDDFGEETATEMLDHAIKQGMMTEDEVVEKVEKEIEKADVSTLVEILKEVLKHE